MMVKLQKYLSFLRIKDLKELKRNILKTLLSQEGIKELEELFEVLNYGQLF